MVNLDDEGSELPDFDAAKAEAVNSVRELVSDAVKHEKPVPDWKIEIVDEAGKVLDFVNAREVLYLALQRPAS
jgi:hypothetical protein